MEPRFALDIPAICPHAVAFGPLAEIMILFDSQKSPHLADSPPCCLRSFRVVSRLQKGLTQKTAADFDPYTQSW